MLMPAIQRWKDRGLTPDKVSKAEAGEAAGGRLVELYKGYQERLRAVNAADFGDLLLHCLTLFQEHPDVLQIYQDRFSHILVDEYQDTNVAQYLWLRLLAQAGAISAASAMTTNRSMAGAAPRSATFSSSNRTSRRPNHPA